MLAQLIQGQVYESFMFARGHFSQMRSAGSKDGDRKLGGQRKNMQEQGKRLRIGPMKILQGENYLRLRSNVAQELAELFQE